MPCSLIIVVLTKTILPASSPLAYQRFLGETSLHFVMMADERDFGVCVCVSETLNKLLIIKRIIKLTGFIWHDPGLFRSLKLLPNSLPRLQAETRSGGYITQLNMTTWAYRLYTFPATCCRVLEADWLSSFQQGTNPHHPHHPPLSPNTVTINLIYQSRSLDF